MNKIEDSYYILSLELPKIIYSRMRVKLLIKSMVLWFLKVYNYKLKNITFLCKLKDIYELGLMEIKTLMDNIVIDMVRIELKKFLYLCRPNVKLVMNFA